MSNSQLYSTNSSVYYRILELLSSGQMTPNGEVTFVIADFENEYRTLVYSIRNCKLVPNNHSNDIKYTLCIVEAIYSKYRFAAGSFTATGKYSRDKAYHERKIQGGKYKKLFKVIVSEHLGAKLFKQEGVYNVR